MRHTHDPSEESEGADHEEASTPGRRRVDKWTVIQTATSLLLLALAAWEALRR